MTEKLTISISIYGTVNSPIDIKLVAIRNYFYEEKPSFLQKASREKSDRNLSGGKLAVSYGIERKIGENVKDFCQMTSTKFFSTRLKIKIPTKSKRRVVKMLKEYSEIEGKPVEKKACLKPSNTGTTGFNI